ncbi:MAG: TolC family protein [Prevotellaceae bacterium]|jgi:cobalt-zinc-cadmium efflux system outer membrane protein|nr:TolC family protein [Prevotellaceae bacterium]
MNAFSKAFVFLCGMLSCISGRAQNDTLYLSTTQIEHTFIQQNLQLIIEKLNIEKAEAAIVQAKLWPNPTLTIDQINLWTTGAQRGGEDEIIPPLFSSFGRNTEFSVSVEQLILMGGKRRKLIDMEKASKDIAVQYFEELLCQLKAELRINCAELAFAQKYAEVLKQQQGRLTALISNYREQVRQGNISQSQLLRLQAALLELQTELNETYKDINSKEKDLRILLNMARPVYIQMTDVPKKNPTPESLSPLQLMEEAAMLRPNIRRSALQSDYFKKSIRYEKSQRVPDISLHAVYDRAGGVVSNFFGFGISIDLPFFNRNQGAIKSAEIDFKQSITEATYLQIAVHNEVIQAFDNYRLAHNFSRQIADDFIHNLDEICESYTRNFINKHIGIVEFLDFFDSYKENKRAVLSAEKELIVSFEELQLSTGRELQ